MEFDFKAVASRLIGAGVAFGAGKVSTSIGVTVDPATQASIVVAVYAALHKVFEHLFKKHS